MQHTLLGLGLLLIAAIAAALAAPFFVDWNAWRPAFETRAAGLLGTRVAIKGPIRATLLPSPSFVLHDVDIGSGGLRVARLRGMLSLGALMRGEVEAEDLVLHRPSIRLTVERDGRVILPWLATAVGADPITISRIAVEDGMVAIENRAAETTTVLTEVTVAGELRSLTGPFRIEGSARHDRELWKARLQSGRFADGTMRVRLGLEREQDGVMVESDGALAWGDGAPHYEGKTNLSWRGERGLTRLSGAVRAGLANLTLDGIELGFGDEPAIELDGRIELDLLARKFEAKLTTRRLDLDRGSRPDTARGFSHAVGTLQDLAGLTAGLPYAGRIIFSADSVNAGGGLVRDLRAELGVRGERITLRRVEARLPGRAALKLDGEDAADAPFAGQLSVEAEQPAAFLRWLAARPLIADALDEPILVSGRLALRTKPSGVEFETELQKIEGVGAVIQALAGGELGLLLARIMPLPMPIKAAGRVAGQKDAALQIETVARFGEFDARVAARLAPNERMPLSEAQLVVAARDTSALLALAGRQAGIATPGEAKFELATAAGRGETVRVTSRLLLPRLQVSADGEVSSAADGRLEPKLALKLEAADVRMLAGPLARAATERIPAAGTAQLVRAPEGFALEQIKVRARDANISGRVLVRRSDAHLVGRLAIDEADFGLLLALVLGRPASDGQGSGYWPDGAFTEPALDGLAGEIDFEIGKLKMLHAVGDQARFKARFGDGNVAIDGFAAGLAGGRAAGSAKIARAGRIGFEAGIELTGMDLARLLAAKPGTIGGRGDLKLAVSAVGTTPAGLMASLAGQGMLSLERAEFDRLDPSALASVVRSSDGPPPDAAATAALLSRAFERGPLVLTRVEAPVSLLAGSGRLNAVRAQVAGVDIAGQGSLDFSRLEFDAALEFEAPAPEKVTARPRATVRFRGPLGAPERRIEAGQLAAVLALFAVERETRKLEEAERLRPPAATEPPTSTVPPRVKAPPRPVRAPPATEPRPSELAPLPPPMDIRPHPGVTPTRPPRAARDERFVQ